MCPPPHHGNFWSFLCRDELQDEQLLDNMESAEHDLDGEGGTKPQPKGLVFKIASKRKCSPTMCPVFGLRGQGSEPSLVVAFSLGKLPRTSAFLWAIKPAKTQLEILRELWALLFAVFLFL